MPLLAGLVCAGCAGGSETAIGPDPDRGSASTSVAVYQPTPAERILADMCLVDKAPQVLWVGFTGKSMSSGTARLLIEDGRMGGLIMLQHNIGGEKTIRSLTSAIQEKAKASGLPLQLFIGVDQEGGALSPITAGMPRVPAPSTLGEDSTPEDAGALAAGTADRLLELGVNLNLGPVADVAPEGSYMGKRSFGDDPELVPSFVSAVVQGYEDKGLVSVVKHFPGHGSADGNTHGAKVVADLPREIFAAVHLPAFQAAIDAGVEGVMLSHITATAFDTNAPASRSSVIIGLLRDEIGFEGLIVTDSVAMVAARSGVGMEEAAIASLRAGADVCIVIATADQELSVRNAIVKAVEDGSLSEERLDEAVLRVIEAKLRHGLVFAD